MFAQGKFDVALGVDLRAAAVVLDPAAEARRAREIDDRRVQDFRSRVEGMARVVLDPLGRLVVGAVAQPSHQLQLTKTLRA